MGAEISIFEIERFGDKSYKIQMQSDGQIIFQNRDLIIRSHEIT